jgi:uncharacterized damage-inducible protein DinB
MEIDGPQPSEGTMWMKSADLLIDGLGRVREVVHEVADGLTAEQLAYRPAAGANSISWLIWHLSRVQDDHIADVAGREQVWTAGGWVGRFGLSLDDAATGYGHSAAQVAAVRVSSPDLLTGYHDAVHQASVDFVRTLTDADLDRIVDERWDPPVSLGVRLISVIDDDAQHAGQAAYVRGLIIS